MIKVDSSTHKNRSKSTPWVPHECAEAPARLVLENMQLTNIATKCAVLLVGARNLQREQDLGRRMCMGPWQEMRTAPWLEHKLENS